MDWAVRVSHYLDPRAFELQRDVILLLSGGRVVETIVGGQVSGGLKGLAENTLDLENAVALPGFVNCHAHLDLSHLHRQVPRGLKFHEWAPAIIAGRMVDPAIVQAGIDDACRMMAGSGTTAVLDISVAGDAAPHLHKQGLRGVLALEVLGWSGDAAEKAMQHADDIVRERFSLESERLGKDAGDAGHPTDLAGVDYGFSPHAPFSTSPELYQHAYGRAFGDGRVCTTHVNETREELEFIRTGGGPLRELLTKLGVGIGDFKGYGDSPMTLLLRDWLGPWLPAVDETGAPSASSGLPGLDAVSGSPLPGGRGTSFSEPQGVPSLVLVHGNYPEGEDLQWIARTRPTVCWCPRSHAFFGHDPWPLGDYIETGANLTLGTDSLASNDGLDMWGEIATAAKAHPDASRAQLLRMATVNGRSALGIPEDAADIAIWSLPEGASDAPLEQMLQHWVARHPNLIASFSQGQLIARAV